MHANKIHINNNQIISDLVLQYTIAMFFARKDVLFLLVLFIRMQIVRIIKCNWGRYPDVICRMPINCYFSDIEAGTK